MKNYADLEISFHRRTDDAYTIEGRFTSAGDAAEISFGAKVPVEMQLDLIQLQDYLPEMEKYGQALTQAVFVPEVKKIFLYAQAAAGNDPLRLRLLIGPGVPELHNIHWEAMLHPLDGTLLSANQNILFSRYLTSENWAAVKLSARASVRALVAVAGPENLANYKLTPINVAQETAQVRDSLKGIEITCLPSVERRCTLTALADELRQGYDILYLVAHGSMVSGVPVIWLEDETGAVKRVAGKDLAEQISNLAVQPRLVILASCESAGKSIEDQNDNQALQALGPLLAEAGVPAVIAMQGKISMSSVARMMPVFFEELLKDGVVDRALAAARNVLLAGKAQDLWMPVLFSRLSSGEIWHEEVEKKQLDKVLDLTHSSLKLQWFWFPLIFLVVVGVGIGLYFGLRQKQKPVMTGNFRIAIASFAETGQGLPDKIGYTIAESIHSRLVNDLKEISGAPTVEIWGTDRIGVIDGKTPEVRAEKAAQLADEIHAYMVIYGVVQADENGITVIPEFYLDRDGFYEGQEITGQYASPFSLPLANSPKWATEFDRKILTQSDVFSTFSQGLTLFAIQDYANALKIFLEMQKIENWDDKEGRKVLYALTGFTAGKVGDYDLAEQVLNQSLALDPEYSRPYIGLAGIAYMRSLKPFEQSKKPTDIDFTLLQQCDTYLEKARQAKNKPPMAEVEAKINFAQGQCSLMTTYSGHGDSYEAARSAFEQVVAAYNDGKNPRVQELAGESYARLGLIFQLTKDPTQASANYQKAAQALRTISSERAKLYQDRANTLSGITPTP